jgi:hypothetical protein
MKQISRRKLLIMAGGIGVGALAVGFAKRQSDARSFVQAIIYRKVPGIIFEGVDLDLLVEDIALATTGKSGMLSYDAFKHVVGVAVDSEFVASIKDPIVRRIVAAYEYPVMSAFFMATDFFPEGYRVGRKISYLHSSDPYLGCGNPLARFDDA